MALQEAWLLLKSMYREPEDEDELKHNKNIMRNPAGFDIRWCATPDCEAMAKRGSYYCVPCNEEKEGYGEHADLQELETDYPYESSQKFIPMHS